MEQVKSLLYSFIPHVTEAEAPFWRPSFLLKPKPKAKAGPGYCKRSQAHISLEEARSARSGGVSARPTLGLPARNLFPDTFWNVLATQNRAKARAGQCPVEPLSLR